MAKGKNQYVVPTKDGWGVKGEGNSKVGKYFWTPYAQRGSLRYLTPIKGVNSLAQILFNAY